MGVGALWSVFHHADEAPLHIHIFLQFFFFFNYLFSEYSHLEKQCESTCQIWKDKWIVFSINPLLYFFYKIEGIEFSKMHRIFRDKYFLLCFVSLQYSFVLLPWIIPVKWLYSSRICHSLEKETSLWRIEFRRGWWSDNLRVYGLFFLRGEWLAPWNGYFQAHLFLQQLKFYLLCMLHCLQMG